MNANKIAPDKLNEKIAELNNEQKYDESITILEEIINDKASSAYEVYNAYLQKALTYKRIFNYTEVMINLEEAKKWGSKGPYEKKALSRIKIEELFINFDLLKFEEVDHILPTITEEDVNNLDGQSKAFYVGLLGVLDMKKNNLTEARKKYDESIELLAKHSPKDLPNVYRKKIALYSLLNDEKSALESYEKGLYYAEKYNMGIYKIGMHEAMSKFYHDKEDYKSAFEYHLTRMEEFNRYNVTTANDKLKVVERDLLKKRKDLEIKYEKNIRFFMVAIVVILLAFLLVLLKFFKVNREKRILVERDNARMREELENLSKEKNEKGESKLNLEKYNLSDRQIEIIELVKKGKTNKEIGADLFISENTVKYHLKIIYNVMGIENRFDLK
ncbi:MAG TPA: helix-turn-helix transcriptional regulator [Moheibacter sp.]|nr:helix-turn-helix transcriptional regulator [Moheibacter sp.]